MSELHLTERTSLGIPSTVLARKAAGETVLLNLADEQYYSLTGVGTRLWEVIESGADLGGVIHTLAGEFEVDRDVLVTDIHAVVGDLAANGLLVIDLG